MADRTTTDTRAKLRRNRQPRRTSQVDSNFEQPQENLSEINTGNSEMSDQQVSTETGKEKDATQTGIDIPELGRITFTEAGHKLFVPL
jgi:hypothetical protein